MESDLSNSVSLLASVIEAGASAQVEPGQKRKFEGLLDLLKRSLANENDALFALERLLRKPYSKGARLLLVEELLSLSNPSVLDESLSLAKEFMSPTAYKLYSQQVNTRSGLYFENHHGLSDMVIGDAGNNYQNYVSLEKPESGFHLSATARKLLASALRSTFPNEADLRFSIYNSLSLDLNLIASSKRTSNVIFDLIKWAEANGKLRELIEVVREANPDNPEVKNFISILPT